jgi:hypothetical protein
MRAMRILRVAALAAVTIGCGDATGDGPLVGTWSRDAADRTTRLVFDADGTFTSDDAKKQPQVVEEHGRGAWLLTTSALERDEVTDAAPGRTRTRATYYVNDRRLYLQALLPTGAHAGVVGTWVGTSRTDQLDASGMATATTTRTTTLELRPDGTLVETVAGSGSAPAGDVRAGSYTVDAATGELVVTLGGATTDRYDAPDGAALGQSPYTR